MAALQMAALQMAAKQEVALQAAPLQVAASPCLEIPAVGVRLAASPGRDTGFGTSRAKAVWMAKAVSLDWVEGRDRSQCTAVEMAKSPAGVPLHFAIFSVFSWEEERFQVTARALQIAAFERLWRRRRGM
jgi:hypothetical protein